MPEKIVSDNGTQFTSAEFAQFCAENGIDHTTTAPFHPQSNGQAERFVDTFKRAVKKIREGRGSMNAALDLFLLTYRSTPNRSAPDGRSPSEIMFGRRIRTCLELLRPPLNRPPEPVQHQASKRSFDRGDTVFVKIYANNTWSWVPGTIIEKVGRVMYNVWVEGRRLVRSHLNQLRSRTQSSQDRSSIANQPAIQGKLPLNVLLDAWDLPATSAEPLRTTSTSTASTVSDTLQSPSLSPPECMDHVSPASSLDQSSSTSTSRSSSSTSSSFESAVASTPTVQQPWRSTRIRRPPQRFDLYRRF